MVLEFKCDRLALEIKKNEILLWSMDVNISKKKVYVIV
jgi:hypothetical protein